MKPVFKKLCLFALGCFAASPLIAQSPSLEKTKPLAAEVDKTAKIISLDDALDLVVRSNPDLEETRITLKNLVRVYENQWREYLPDFSASLSFGAGGTLFLPGEANSGDSSSLSLRSTISTSLDFSLAEQKIQKELNLRAAEISQNNLISQLRRDTRKAYISILSAQENLKLQTRNLQQAEDRYKLSQKKYQLGALTEQDLLKAELNAQTLKPALLQAKANLAQLKKSFARILGFPRDYNFELNGVLNDHFLDEESVKPELFSSDKVYSQKKYSLDLQSNQNNIELNQKSHLPSISASLAWALSPSDIFDAETWENLSDRWSLSLGLSLPISAWLPGSSVRQKDLQLREEQEILLLQKKKDQEIVWDTFENLLAELDLLKANLVLNKQTLNLAQKALQSSRLAWEAGRLSSTDLEGAEEALFIAQNDLLSNQYRYLSSLCDLIYILGDS